MRLHLRGSAWPSRDVNRRFAAVSVADQNRFIQPNPRALAPDVTPKSTWHTAGRVWGMTRGRDPLCWLLGLHSDGIWDWAHESRELNAKKYPGCNAHPMVGSQHIFQFTKGVWGQPTLCRSGWQWDHGLIVLTGRLVMLRVMEGRPSE